MTRCSGLKKDVCKEPCSWVSGKGCKKPENVAQAEKEAKIATKLAKAAAIQAAKDNALAAKAAAKASKAVKVVKEAKIREVKAIKAVKDAKITKAKKEAEEKVVKAKEEHARVVRKEKKSVKKEVVISEKEKFSWDPKGKWDKFVFDTDLPLNEYKVQYALYNGSPIQKIKNHSKVLIINMLAKKLNIREVYRNLYYVPSKDTFIALARKRSTKEPNVKNNNDFIGIEFKYAKDVKYKLSLKEKEIVIIENMVGKLDINSNQPLTILKQTYNDVVSVLLFK